MSRDSQVNRMDRRCNHCLSGFVDSLSVLCDDDRVRESVGGVLAIAAFVDEDTWVYSHLDLYIYLHLYLTLYLHLYLYLHL